jgi:hypothetical protein
VHRVDHKLSVAVRVGVAVAVAVGLLGAAALALSPTQSRRELLRQLQTRAAPAQAAATAQRAPAAGARSVRRSSSGHTVIVTLTPNHARGPISISLHVFGHHQSLSGARVRVGFSMPSMRMWNVYTAALSASARGHYAAMIPVLGMAGDWRLRIELTPRSGRPFAVDVDERIAP